MSIDSCKAALRGCLYPFIELEADDVFFREHLQVKEALADSRRACLNLLIYFNNSRNLVHKLPTQDQLAIVGVLEKLSFALDRLRVALYGAYKHSSSALMAAALQAHRLASELSCFNNGLYRWQDSIEGWIVLDDCRFQVIVMHANLDNLNSITNTVCEIAELLD